MMNRVELVFVVVHMVWMNALRFLVTGVMIISISSCAQQEYVDVQSSGIQHSSPEVISLYEGEAVPNQEKSGGFLGWFLDGMLGSSPDDDYRDRGASQRRNEFISKNGDSIRNQLESKRR